MAAISSIYDCSCAFSTGTVKTSPRSNTISDIAFSSLSTIASLFTFPIRYIGAKDWSLPGILIRAPYYIFKKICGGHFSDIVGKGYHKRFERQLTKQEAKENLVYSSMVQASFKMNQDYLTPFGFKFINLNTLSNPLEGLITFEHSFVDVSTGLRITIAENQQGELLINFGAKHSIDHVSELDEATKKIALKNQNRSIVANTLGLCPEIYTKAVAAVKHIQSLPEFRAKNISLSGTCLGGSVAQYVALILNKKAICFNSFPLGAGLQTMLGAEKLQQSDAFITNISVKNDFINDNGVLNVGNHLLSFIGIKTPGNFGRQYVVSSSYKSGAEAHTGFMSALMEHLGFDKKTKPYDLPASFFS